MHLIFFPIASEQAVALETWDAWLFSSTAVTLFWFEGASADCLRSGGHCSTSTFPDLHAPGSWLCNLISLIETGVVHVDWQLSSAPCSFPSETFAWYHKVGGNWNSVGMNHCINGYCKWLLNVLKMNAVYIGVLCLLVSPIYTYIYPYPYPYLYLYIYIYVPLHTCTYIYTYTNNCVYIHEGGECNILDLNEGFGKLGRSDSRMMCRFHVKRTKHEAIKQSFALPLHFWFNGRVHLASNDRINMDEHGWTWKNYGNLTKSPIRSWLLQHR